MYVVIYRREQKRVLVCNCLIICGLKISAIYWIPFHADGLPFVSRALLAKVQLEQPDRISPRSTGNYISEKAFS